MKILSNDINVFSKLHRPLAILKSPPAKAVITSINEGETRSLFAARSNRFNGSH